MKDKLIGGIFETWDYSKFKRVPGNRDIVERRKARVRKSIEKVGWIRYPILVNKRFEIIDGQARFEIAREDHLPVYYFIIDDIGIEECRAMNNSTTKWDVKDDIASYAELGDECYIFLKNLLKETGLPIKVIGHICTDRQATKDRFIELVSDGDFKLDEEQKKEVRREATMLAEFTPLIKSMSGRKECMYNALVWIFKHTTADIKRLKKVFPKVAMMDVAIGNNYDALGMIEAQYNSGYSKKINFQLEYRKDQQSRGKGYEEKYKTQLEKVFGKEE